MYTNVPYINSLLPSLDKVLREVKAIREDIDKSIAQTPGLARKVLALTSGARENMLRLNAHEKSITKAVADIEHQRLTYVGQFRGQLGVYLRFKDGAGDIFEFFADPINYPGRFGYVRSVRGLDINSVNLYKYTSSDGSFSGETLTLDGHQYHFHRETVDGAIIPVWDIPEDTTCKTVMVCARYTAGRYVVMMVDCFGYHITEVTGSTPNTMPTLVEDSALTALLETAGMQIVLNGNTGRTALLTYDGEWVKDKPFRMDIRY